MRWVLLILFFLALPAGAGALWQGFAAFAEPDPEPKLPPGPAYSADGTFLCERAIRGAEARYGLPPGLLLQIGLTEAGYRDGVWPWTVNASGESHYFDSRAEATRFVASQEAAGAERIDTGCLQINRYWHPTAFPDLDAAFDPERNADYAARFILELYSEFGSWEAAVGAYHSRDPVRSENYLSRVEATYARAKNLASRMAVERFALVATGPNLMPALSANLEDADVFAIARAAEESARSKVTPRSAPRPESQQQKQPLPEPQPGQGHALFSTGGGPLFPGKLNPLFD